MTHPGRHGAEPDRDGCADPTRRRLIAGVLGVCALGHRSALAQTSSAPRFSSIRVDVQPLIARGGRGSAQLIASVLPRELAKQFTDVVEPGTRAPVLIARIDTIYLSLFADTPSTGFGSFGTTDSLEGAGVVVAGRQVLSTTPLRVTLPASYSGVYYLPDIDQRRVVSLCESFASWLRRAF